MVVENIEELKKEQTFKKLPKYSWSWSSLPGIELQLCSYV